MLILEQNWILKTFYFIVKCSPGLGLQSGDFLDVFPLVCTCVMPTLARGSLLVHAAASSAGSTSSGHDPYHINRGAHSLYCGDTLDLRPALSSRAEFRAQSVELEPSRAFLLKARRAFQVKKLGSARKLDFRGKKA